MLASDFIVAREKLCDAHIFNMIDTTEFLDKMHKLFVEAGVSKGFNNDCEKAIMLRHNRKFPKDQWL